MWTWVPEQIKGALDYFKMPPIVALALVAFGYWLGSVASTTSTFAERVATLEAQMVATKELLGVVVADVEEHTDDIDDLENAVIGMKAVREYLEGL